MQAIGRQPQQAPDGAPVHYERHRPEQTKLYRLVQQHAATFFAETEAAAGANLPQFVKDEFGVAYSNAEITSGLWAVAVPVWQSGKVVLALSVACPAFRIGRRARVKVEKDTRATATRISALRSTLSA